MRFIGLIVVLVLTFVLTGCTQKSKDPEVMSEVMISRYDRASTLKPEMTLSEASSNSSPAAQSGLTKNQRIADATSLISIIDHQYAPLEWKTKLFGLSFKGMNEKLIADVSRDNMTDLDFYDAMIRYACSFNDGHFSMRAPTNYVALLGFGVDQFGGEVLIIDIDDRLLPKEKFPFAVGDRLVAIDGVPIEKVKDQLRPYICFGGELGKDRLAAINSVYRPQDNFPSVPEGRVDVTVFSRKEGREMTAVLNWIGIGEKLALSTRPGFEKSNMRATKINNDRTILEDLRNDKIDGYFASSRYGQRTPLFPLWDTFVKRNDDPIVTGEFTIGDKKIGYIRIQEWDFNEESKEKFFKVLEDDLKYFEEKTDILLIDQKFNPGGDACFMSDAIGLFSVEPMRNVSLQIRANRYWLAILESESSSCDREKNKKDCEIAEGMVFALRRALERGAFLAGPVNFCSYDGLIQPAMIYSKPILILIDEMDISCGDAFPILMQENGRAKLFGMPTSGGGGNVIGKSFLGYSDFSFRYTASLMWRPLSYEIMPGLKSFYVENFGAQPDYKYQETASDYLNGYKDYKSSVEKALLEMIEGK